MKREKMINKLRRFCDCAVCYNCPLDPCVSFEDLSTSELKEYMQKAGLPNAKKKIIEIKYFDQDIEQIQKISVGDWIDLRIAETVFLKAGEYRLLRLGVGMILPDGYEALVLPRSSTPDKFGIVCANSMGVIDNSYSGEADEWRFPALAIRDTAIYKGERIAQFRIMKNQPNIEFKIVDHLNEISRGGICSTGKR